MTTLNLLKMAIKDGHMSVTAALPTFHDVPPPPVPNMLSWDGQNILIGTGQNDLQILPRTDIVAKARRAGYGWLKYALNKRSRVSGCPPLLVDEIDAAEAFAERHLPDGTDAERWAIAREFLAGAML